MGAVMPGAERVLLVEDEPLIAMMLEDVLEALGHIVTDRAETVPEALALAERADFDVAILDVHLRGEVAWPVADALVARGKPFLVATGGSAEGAPDGHSGAPLLEKPYTMDGVKAALERLAG